MIHKHSEEPSILYILCIENYFTFLSTFGLIFNLKVTTVFHLSDFDLKSFAGIFWYLVKFNQPWIYKLVVCSITQGHLLATKKCIRLV